MLLGVEGGAILPYFSGGPQFGGGLSNVVGRMMRGVILPSLGRVAKGIKTKGTKRLLNLGQGILSDAIAGKNIGQSLKTRGLNEARGAAQDVFHSAANSVLPSRRKRKNHVTRKRRSLAKVRRSRQIRNPPGRRAKRSSGRRSRADIYLN